MNVSTVRRLRYVRAAKATSATSEFPECDATWAHVAASVPRGWQNPDRTNHVHIDLLAASASARKLPTSARSSLMIAQVTHPRILDCHWSMAGLPRKKYSATCPHMDRRRTTITIACVNTALLDLGSIGATAITNCIIFNMLCNNRVPRAP